MVEIGCIQTFDTPEFEEKRPFPLLEVLALDFWYSHLPISMNNKETFDEQICEILTRYSIAVSPQFFSRFLSKTHTLRSFVIHRKLFFFTYSLHARPPVRQNVQFFSTPPSMGIFTQILEVLKRLFRLLFKINMHPFTK